MGLRGTTRGRSRLRSGLLVLQAAISVVLLVGTGLFVASLRAARGVDLGFDPDGVLMVRLQPEGGYPGGEAMTALYRETLRLDIVRGRGITESDDAEDSHRFELEEDESMHYYVMRPCGPSDRPAGAPFRADPGARDRRVAGGRTRA